MPRSIRSLQLQMQMLLLFATFWLDLINVICLARALCGFLTLAGCVVAAMISAIPFITIFISTQLFNETLTDMSDQSPPHNLDESISAKTLLKQFQALYTDIMLGDSRGLTAQRLTISAAVVSLVLPIITHITMRVSHISLVSLFLPVNYWHEIAKTENIFPSAIGINSIYPYLMTAWLGTTLIATIVAIGLTPTLWYLSENDISAK